MPSETDLLNDALGQIGASRITSIDDGSVNANHCQTFYPALRDGMIRAHHWNFAIVRVELAQDATPPAAGWSYSYTLPADCLKVIEYNGGSLAITNPDLPRVLALFKIEGRLQWGHGSEAVEIDNISRFEETGSYEDPCERPRQQDHLQADPETPVRSAWTPKHGCIATSRSFERLAIFCCQRTARIPTGKLKPPSRPS
jgi:hypothetical protein